MVRGLVGLSDAPGYRWGFSLPQSRDPNLACSPKRVDVGLCQRACPMLHVGEAELSQEC